MALTSRKAIVAPSLLIHRCPLCLRLGYNPSRPFSCKPYNNAMNATRSPNVDKDLAGYMKKKKSRVVEMKQISGSKIPDDVGVLSHTLIRPPNRDMPRLFGKTWKLRLKVEWWWLKTRVLNFGSLVYFLWWFQRKMPRSKRMRFHLRSRPAIALDLHNRFYTSLASGDFQSLRQIVCSGLAAKSKAQITHRVEGNAPPQSWKIIRYTSFIRPPFFLRLFPWPLTSLIPGSHAKIVSDRVAPFPFGDIFIRQCVVRIRSLQALDRGDGTPPSQAKLTEYLVIQQMRIEGQTPTWKIWGTTKATSKEAMERMVGGDAKGGSKYTLLDRLKTFDPTKAL